MKKYILVFFLTLAAVSTAIAQVSFSYSAGYGDYKMEDMNFLLESSLSSVRTHLPPARITDKFPGYVTHNIDAAYRFRRHEIGLKGTYMTTGGKIAYSDYSGRFYEKTTLNGFRLGVMYRFHFIKTRAGNLPLSFYGELSPAVNFTALRYAALLELPDYNVHDSKPGDNISTDDISYSFQPLVGMQLLLTRNVFIVCSGGYDFEIGATLKLTGDVWLGIDWSGFRSNLGLGYMF